MDNDLYIAMREGRVPLRVDVEQDGDTWVAKYDQFGIQVEVRDESQTFAHSQAIEQIFQKARDGKFEVRVA